MNLVYLRQEAEYFEKILDRNIEKYEKNSKMKWNI